LNRGLLLYEMGLLSEACASYERALASDPGYTAAQYNLGLAHLTLHQFSSGFDLHERRITVPVPRAKLRANESLKLFELQSRWQGPAADAGKTLAVWTEQGVGDQLVFATLIPDLVAAGINFVYEVDGRLLPAFKRSFPAVRFAPMADPPAAEMLHAERVALAGSVPMYFRRSVEDFAKQPQQLLRARPDRVAHYQAQFAPAGDGPRIALSWYSKRDDRLGSRKNAPLEKFATLAEIPHATLVDVQYGDTAAERREFVRTTGKQLLHDDAVDYFNDLDNMLAMLEACDFLITTSNVNAHLAGALGKPVWLLYLADNTPFYYWAHDGNYRSLWYPSVRIVSAPSIHDWGTLVAHVAQMVLAYGRNPLDIPRYAG
jgi:tetratricopeptide (TPR) repeat protein